MTRTFRFVALLGLCLSGSQATAAINFVDESNKLADVNNFSYESWGAAWGDLNSDGFPDVYAGNHRNYGQMLVNQLNGTFSRDNNADADGMWTRGFAHYDDHGATWADMDNDGDLDLLMSEAVQSNRWLRNDNGVLFTEFATGTQTGYMPINKETGTTTNEFFEIRQDCNGNNGSWGVLTDLNHTGRLELICVRNGEDFPFDVQSPDGGGNISLPTLRPVIDMAPGDFDGDLRNDYVLLRGRDRPNGANLVNANTVETQMNVTSSSNNQELTIVTDGSLTLHNLDDDSWRGNGRDYRSVRIGPSGYQPTSPTFTLDVNDSDNWGLNSSSSTTANRLFVGYDTAEGAWKIRFNSTGNWVYVHFYATSDAPITSVSQPSGNVGDNPAHPRLYRNTTGGFVDAGLSIGLDMVQCGSVVAGDFDNDMDLDLYMACRDGAANIANELFENDGSGNFTRRQNHGAEGIIGGATFSGAGNADSVVTADYNLDGFLDLFVINGMNMRPRWVGGPKQLFKNTPNNNRWMMFDLEGVSSNRDGIGAKLWITTPDGTVQYREQNGGYHRWSQNHMRVHTGLGSNTTASVQVQWPSGQVDTYTGLSANTVYKLVEAGDASPRFDDGVATVFCGEPAISPSADRATFLWRDCAGSGDWRLRVTGGNTGSRLDYIGRIEAPGGVSSLQPQSIESNDVLDQSNPNALAYQLVIYGSGQDGFDFTVPANACFVPQLPDTLPVYLGSTRTELTTQDVDLDTGLACAPQPDADGDGLSDAEELVLGTNPNVADTDGGSVNDGNEVANGTDPLDPSDDVDPSAAACGAPTFSGNTDRALFLWKDCGFGGPAARWNLRVSGGGGAFDTFTGQLSSDATLVAQGFSIEGADVLDTVPGDGLLDYALIVGNAGIDGFQVDVPAGSSTCFDPGSLASGADARLGGSQQPLSGPIQLEDLSPCSVDPTCTEPSYNPATEPGIYLWRDCAAGGANASWSVRIVGGGLPWSEFAGLLTVNTPVTATGVSIEPSDVLDSSPGDGIIDFSLFVVNAGIDGFDVVIPSGALSCFDAQSVPAGAGVFVGGDKQTPAGAFNLEDLGVCQ